MPIPTSIRSSFLPTTTRELDYAKEAIDRARNTFQVEMRIYTVMEVVLVVLNGVLIVGVVGWGACIVDTR